MIEELEDGFVNLRFELERLVRVVSESGASHVDCYPHEGGPVIFPLLKVHRDDVMDLINSGSFDFISHNVLLKFVSSEGSLWVLLPTNNDARPAQ